MKSSNSLLGLALFSLLGILFLYMAGFFTEKRPEKRMVKVADFSEVDSVILQSQDIQVQRVFPGTVVAAQKATLSARITAKVAEVLVNVGDEVKQGDVLMRLESQDLDARVKQAEQRLSSAQARLNTARKEYRRAQELAVKKLLSQSEFDEAENELKIAQADFKQAQATVIEAETTFGFSLITAPFNGLITQKNANQGDTALPGMQLFSLYNPETLQLQANISEAQISDIQHGSKLTYQLPTYHIEEEGVVTEISPAADNTSRSFIIKLDMHPASFVYPGSYGKVQIESEKQTVLTVPQKAVYQVGQLDYVKVIEKGILHKRLIQLGADFRVRKGLKVGDEVVIEPLKYK